VQKELLKAEIKPLTWLALPLIGSGLIEFSSGFIATLMLGHVSHEALAAGSLMNSIFTTLMVLLWGMFTAVSVLIAHQYGAKNKEAIVQVVRSGLLLAVITTIPCMIFLRLAPYILQFFKQSPALVELIKPGLAAFSWGIFPDLITLTLLQFAVGLGHGRVNLLFSIIWTPCNVFFVAAFIFGLWHFPNLGVTGLGWGFTCTMWILMFVIIIYFLFAPTYKEFRQILFQNGQLGFIKSILKVGLPLGGVYTIDLVYLLIFALVMGTFGITMLAAHQIVWQFFWQTSVISFAIGQAITVKVGHYVGAQTRERIQPVTVIGTVFMGSIMLLFSIMYWAFPTTLVRLDLGHHPNNEVLALAIHFFAVAGFVQILQAGWIGLLATLRGLGDTRVLMVLSAVAQYGVGLPLAYLMAYGLHLQGQGLWYALVLDSFVFIALAYWRLKQKVLV
jgi:MATE family multidrug resistance protein